MKIVSFNINGIRAHFHQLYEIVKKYDPDIIGLQETKVENSLFPKDGFDHKYHIYLNGRKSYHGVALFSKKKLFDINIRFFKENSNEEHRVISANIFFQETEIQIINIYCPQGENRNNKIKFNKKKNFYKNLIKYVQKKIFENKNIILMGDMNISPEDQDIGIDPYHQNRWINLGKCGFLPEERIWMKKLKSFGLIDTYTKRNFFKKNKFSWFDYRSNGFLNKVGLRIDFILVSKKLFDSCRSSGIDYSIRSMKRPSDHAPIWAFFEI